MPKDFTQYFHIVNLIWDIDTFESVIWVMDTQKNPGQILYFMTPSVILNDANVSLSQKVNYLGDLIP